VTWGDINAQVKTNSYGVQKLNELFAKFGLDKVHECWKQWMDICETELRKEIAKVPDGIYGPESDYLDDDGIDVLGIVPNEVRDTELAAAKLFVSPALGGESFGMVLVEAFAAATPVVASDIPGFADVASGDAAVLVPPGDELALVDAVTDLLADEDRRVAMGRAARKLAEERYAWPDVARRLESIYERVTA